VPPRSETFLRSLQVLSERIQNPDAFPFTIFPGIVRGQGVGNLVLAAGALPSSRGVFNLSREAFNLARGTLRRGG